MLLLHASFPLLLFIHTHMCTCMCIYIYMLTPPSMNYREVPGDHQSLLHLGFWCMIQFEVPKGEHMYDGSRLHSQFLATLYANTPRDD